MAVGVVMGGGGGGGGWGLKVLQELAVPTITPTYIVIYTCGV